MTNHLVSYYPMILNGRGRRAVEKHQLKPYIDHSVRREPNFDHAYPGISALCRKSMLAPKLKVGDIVVYITVKGNHEGDTKRHHRLVAALRVIEICPDHQTAAIWYQSRGYSDLPTNCILSAPVGWDQTILTKEKAEEAEADYIDTAGEWSVYVICEPIHMNLITPKAIYESDWEAIIGRKTPNTQYKVNLTVTQYNQLCTFF
ncbi:MULTISPECIES: hypothetical protein [unclassified Paenibacillus]|uniref:hypothetical protein n=1 Tax=unclassified Paenibacillus TaxID=185978 RepID=UPI001AE11432|nr:MULTISPECIES: hypothetical protein [unclassified Paenibacillus]MBP1157665.1 hypothetical protein [Paenibacillus sp. PvP091]MBP1171598.1 hypothetical protein [Paenibacillus sp. PvR098]MBP2437979.1 hypothetical protein [Paenibacillus sp. PvP052]